MVIFQQDMIKALDEDAAYLKAMTGKDHGPWFLAEYFFPEEDDEDEDGYNYDEDYPNEDDLEDWRDDEP